MIKANTISGNSGDGINVTVGDLTLVPVARELLGCAGSRSRLAGFAAREAAAVVVISSSGTTAFRITGEKVTLEQLAAEFPGIGDSLRRL